MRIWHKDLIPVLPKQQLLGQWRECCCIARNIAVNGTPNHLLVNKIMDYPIEHFFWYTDEVRVEMNRRGFKVDDSKFLKWIPAEIDLPVIFHSDLFKEWHNCRYMLQCLYNLHEKYDCGGIPENEYEKIVEFQKAWLDNGIHI